MDRSWQIPLSGCYTSGKMVSVSSLLSSPATSAGRTQAKWPAVTPASRDQWPGDSFIGRLPDGERGAILAAGTPARFEDGQILLVQGDVGDFVYVLTGGLVKVMVAASSGAETALVVRSRGDLMGEFALLDDGPRTATARAAGPVTALRVGGGAFMAVLAESPAARRVMTRYVLAKMRASTERCAAERVWDARERLAQVLYELGELHAEPDADGMIRIPLTQGDLGDLAGVAVSTAERVLKDFRRQGAVTTRYREITIKNMAYLGSIRFAA
jgi:CRP/FNR family cyclic AMP-dependent transcriptional regulator